MIAYSLSISFLVTVIIPILMLVIFPEVAHGKGVENMGLYSIIYILSLFALIGYVLYTRRDSEIKLFKSYMTNFNTSHNIRISILFILMLYIGRLLYHLYIYSSPYELLVQQGNQITSGITNQVISYYYIFTNFKLYPLIQGVVVLTLPKKYWPLFFSVELIYASTIYSKYLFFTSILLIIIVYLPNKIKLTKALLFGAMIIIMFFIMRELFGQLRFGEGVSIEYVEIRNMIASGISRIQAFFPIFYAERVLDEWMYGKSLCKVIGLVVPDSLISLPKHCENIDEDGMLFYFGVTELRIINKDLFNFWSEPFANFSVLGVLLIGLTVLLVEKFTVILDSGRSSAIFSWVVLVNCLTSHNSWSAFIGIVCISFVIIWFLSIILDDNDAITDSRLN